jgi:hypothetical protein
MLSTSTMSSDGYICSESYNATNHQMPSAYTQFIIRWWCVEMNPKWFIANKYLLENRLRDLLHNKVFLDESANKERKRKKKRKKNHHHSIDYHKFTRPSTNKIIWATAYCARGDKKERQRAMYTGWQRQTER